MTLTVGSLFSGIGGLDLGLERAGMKVRWQVEIDAWRRSVLAWHWPDIRRYGDVRECGRNNLETVELVAGGFPCQPHSTAGKQLGAADDRNLWPEMRRIIGELRPRWVLAENVPGIRRTIIDGVLSDMERMGYTAWPFGIPACAVGAPHKRERIFICAYAEGQGLAQRMHRQVAYQGAHQKAPQPGCDRPAGLCRPAYNWGRDWPAESRLLRSDHGLSNRVERLAAIGDAVVPQVAEWIGRRIVEVEGA